MQLETPAKSWYWPEEQLEHWLETEVDVYPAAHCIQLDAPGLGWKVPAAQLVHADAEDTEYIVERHKLQAVAAVEV